ncbi:hypothetical protein TWF281_004705 [Arthrobotrys megalospora]
MIVDAAHLFTNPKINLTYPSQLLTVLQTLNRPLFVLFIPSSSDKSPPDPTINWGGNELDAYERVNREFDKGPTPRYLAVLEVGGIDDWKSPTNILKLRWKITTCPTLLRIQLTTLPSSPSSEVGIITSQFTTFPYLPIHLRFFKKADITQLATNFNIFKTKIYEIKTSHGKEYDGWEYKFDVISAYRNKRVKQQVAKKKYEEEVKMRWLRVLFDVEGVDRGDFVMKTKGEKDVEEKFAPEVVESDGGRFYNRVETVGDDEDDEGEAVVGRVEKMDSYYDSDEEGRKGKCYFGGAKSFVSAVESGAEVVDFGERFEVLGSVVGGEDDIKKKGKGRGW